MASTKFQLEESKKPNPRYILELHTIRGMIQEADNMDKGLRTVLGFKLAAQGNAPAPQQPQQPPPMGPTIFAQPAPPPAPPVNLPLHSHFPTWPPQETVPIAGPGAAMSTPTPPPLPTVSTPIPQAATPGITAPSPQTPKSPKGKGGVKRTREDEIEGATPSAPSAPSPKKVKSDWEDVPNEEAWKRDEQAESVKTDEQALSFSETVTKFIDENPESAEAALSALDEILRTYPSAPDMDEAASILLPFR
jgi:hypothetical protein